MNTHKLNASLISMGEFLVDFSQGKRSFNSVTINALVARSEELNGWFDEDNIRFCLRHWGNLLSDQKQLETWLPSSESKTTKTVGLITAGNIPMAGFHDLLCVIASGHRVKLKVSSQDKYLMHFMVALWGSYYPELKEKIDWVDGIVSAQAYITSGSNNSSRYFSYYFKDKPSIIRRNRTSVAILTGEETNTELKGLTEDIFRYYGLGCRNVSKLLVPRGYDINRIFAVIFSKATLMENERYMKNYEYNKAIYLMSKRNFLENGFFMMLEDNALWSPIASLNYEFYDNLNQLTQKLVALQNQLQCVVGKSKLNFPIPTTAFGQTQKPVLNEYADRIDTMKFLSEL